MFPPSGLPNPRRREQSLTVLIDFVHKTVGLNTVNRISHASKPPLTMNRERRLRLKGLREKARKITRDTGVQHDLHHRRPTSRGGEDVEENISIVPVKCHVAFHGLFSNLSPEAIAQILTERWIDPDWEIVARKKFKIT